jgi:hypothetical protein
MFRTIDVPASVVLAMPQPRAVVPRQATAMPVAHPRLLPIDRMLLMLDPEPLTRRDRAMPHALLDPALLVVVARIDRLSLRTRRDAEPDQDGDHMLHYHHKFSFRS